MSETFVLIEDNEINQDLMVRMLKREKYQVEVAGDGESGLELINKVNPVLVLLDLSLPNMDGLEVARILRSQGTTKTIPIIALTAHAMQEHRSQALAAGCNEFETKPIEMSSLLAKIKSLLP